MPLAIPESGSFSAEQESRLYAKVVWRLVPSIFLFFVFGYLDRVNIGFAKLDMMAELHWSDSVYGLGAGMFFLGYFVFEIPSNIILYKMGARKWLACLMVTWGLLSACMMFVQTTEFFYLLRFAIGVAEAGFFPGIIFYLTIWFPKQRRGRVTALFMSAIGISGIVGGPLSGWIMKALQGVHGLAGWQWLFLLEGLPSVVMGAMALYVLDDSIRHARWLSESEKALLERNVVQDNVHHEEISIYRVLILGRVWVLSLVYFLLLMGLYGYLFWTPQIIKTTGVDDVFHVGLLSAIPPLVGVIVMVAIGRRSDRTGERRWHLAWCGFVACLGFIMCAFFSHNTLLVMIALTLATAGVLSTLPLFWSLPTEFLSGAAAAAGIGLINSVGNLSGFISTSAMGAIKDATHATDLGLYLISGCVFAGSVLALISTKVMVKASERSEASLTKVVTL